MTDIYKPDSRLGPERWKTYPKNTKYEISDQGRVRRYYPTVKGYTMVKPLRYKNKRGKFTSITVAIGEDNKKVSLARAVWETFNGPIPEGHIIKFKNGCNSMVDLYNLYTIDNKEAQRNDIIKKNKTRRIPGRKKVIDLDTGRIYPSIRAAEKALMVGKTTISSLLLGKSKTSIIGLNVAYYKEATE